MRILCEIDVRLLAQCVDKVLHHVPQSVEERDIIQSLESIDASVKVCYFISEVGDIPHRRHIRCDSCALLNQINQVKYKIDNMYINQQDAQNSCD